MNYKIAMVPLLLAGLFASCNDSEELIQTNPDYVEAGYGALTLTLKYPDAPKTKAVGDVLPDVAYPEEKTISSVAFFVNTEEEKNVAGVGDQNGNFGSYFSDEPVLDPKGLLEELKEVAAGTPGEYIAKIRHRSDGWGNPQVIVIANYLENGLATKLKDVSNWAELENVVSTAITENPKTPLLMFSQQTIEPWKRQPGGNGGGAASADFDMERLVSRIDIHNNAYDSNTPANGFVLESAQLIRPKTASYLLPNLGKTVDVSTEPFATSGKVVIDGDIQKLDSLYAYENNNADAATATAVQINGTFLGGQISKVIELKKADGVGTTGDPIALARNHRYVVNINPAPDGTDITWNIQVKEWTESDTIKVKPIYAKPDLTEALKTAVFEAGTSGVTWDGTSKVIDMSNATSGDATFKFSTKGTNASVVRLAYAFDKDGSSVSGNDIVKVDKPIITYAGAQVETPITITIPQQANDEKVPLDIYVIVQNGGNLNACDTITIKSRPDYNNVTGAKPVLMKGPEDKELYWAPINVGATTTKNKAVTTANTDITADAGQLFQWGRKFGFAATNNATITAADTTGIGSEVLDSPNTPLGRPVQSNLADMSKWDGKFIYSTSTLKYNWLQINGDGNANPDDSGMEKDAWYQQLWNANEGKDSEVVKTDADPCPKGWRVPTQEEWKAIGADGSTSHTWDGTNLRLTVSGKESGKDLFLPAAGYRGYSAGTSYGQGGDGYYWSSSVPSGSTNASNVIFGSAGKLTTSKNLRALGFSVRCVQE